MNQIAAHKAQQEFFKFQKELRIESVSEKNEVRTIINGKLELIELKIDQNINHSELELLILSTINKGIADASQRIQEKLLLVQRAMAR